LKENRFVFDAGAIALYFGGDEEIRPYFVKALAERGVGYVCEINLAEFYYKTAEKLGLEVAETRHLMIRNSKLEVIAPNEETTRIASRLKLKYKNQLSLADCYALATAKVLKATLITTDSIINGVKEAPTLYFEAR